MAMEIAREYGGNMRLVAGPDKIAAAVKSLAARIENDYRGKRPVMVGVLKGAFVFLSDLMRSIDCSVEVDFVRAASYGDGVETSGRVEITKDIEIDVRGRDVIVVEDIVDTGLTLNAVVEHIRLKGPASLKVCALLVLQFDASQKVSFSNIPNSNAAVALCDRQQLAVRRPGETGR